MKYDLKEIDQEAEWEDFINELKPHSFLHSWKWGELYEFQGTRVFRVGCYREGVLAAIALFIKVEARRGSFLFCPHGPLFLKDEEVITILPELTRYAVEVGKKENCSFIRYCPLLASTIQNKQIFHDLKFKSAPIHMHPELAWILDLDSTEEELLKNMRKTTRYLIRKSQKDGVEIIMSQDLKDIDLFYSVYQATAKRQKFVAYSKDYIRKEFELFSKNNQALLFFGKYHGKTVSVAMIVFYGNSAFYHHSGSLNEDKVNTSYLLQWRVIQEAKRRGYRYYNFWGVSSLDHPQHPWHGLSQFKRGFSGFEEPYIHAQDKVINMKYYLNYFIERIRAYRRGYN